MIFNGNFDKILWIILNGEKYNKTLICDFINLIPEPLKEQMDDAFVKYEGIMNNSNIDILDREDIKGEFYLNNTKYYFILDMVLDSLTIGIKMLFNGEYQKLYELTIYSNCNFDKIQKGDNYYLGRMEEFITNKVINYELLNNFIGVMVLTKESNCFPIYKKINVNMIPDDIKISEVSIDNKIRKRC